MPNKILKKKSVNKDVLTLALERVRRVYDLFDHVAVSFSGGKDSTAVLNVALMVARERQRLPLRVFHFDEEAIPPDVYEYIERIARNPEVTMEVYCLPIKHRNACSREHPYWYTWAAEDKDKWVRPMPPRAITEITGYKGLRPESRLNIPQISALLFPASLGRCCQLLGIRSDESISRYRAVARRTEDNFILKHELGFHGDKIVSYPHVYKAYPIYDWTTRDVWTAPARLGWDYCRYYDLLEMAGIPHAQQRLAPPYGEEPFRQLGYWARTYPELWARMVRRVPGANTAALYSTGELYAYGELPDKPDSMTWPEFLREQVGKHPSAEATLIASRIKDEIRRHRAMTKEPILHRVGHWQTGLSWEFLLMVAIRGDFKNRKVVTTNRGTRQQYYDALQAARTGAAEGGTRY